MPLAATIFIKTVFSFFATVAFGKLFKCPESCLYKAGFVGMVGFGVYIILLSGFGLSSMLSNFAGRWPSPSAVRSLPGGTGSRCPFFPFRGSFPWCPDCPCTGP